MSKFLTAESVMPGHPDKICDIISDKILDELLRQDVHARVACETFITGNLVIVGGEITTDAWVDIQEVVRSVLRNIGYDDPKWGCDYRTCTVINAIRRQSPDIARGVDAGGAGDQGVMYGYSEDGVGEIPIPIYFAHRIAEWIYNARQNLFPYLGPDGKTQVTVEYDSKGLPVRITDVVIAVQHTEEAMVGRQFSDDIRGMIKDFVVNKMNNFLNVIDAKFHINTTGVFLIGGPQADTGMTGRKIMVDTYGGIVSHGGGAFSGKDPTKVDRTASYYARYMANKIRRKFNLNYVKIGVAYSIGEQLPLMINVEHSNMKDNSLTAEIIDILKPELFVPANMISALNLLRPIYTNTACFGHFGRKDFPWEI